MRALFAQPAFLERGHRLGIKLQRTLLHSRHNLFFQRLESGGTCVRLNEHITETASAVSTLQRLIHFLRFG